MSWILAGYKKRVTYQAAAAYLARFDLGGLDPGGGDLLRTEDVASGDCASESSLSGAMAYWVISREKT